MAKVCNAHRIDGEVFYLVRLTAQEIAPLFPAGTDTDKLSEGLIFQAPESPSIRGETLEQGNHKGLQLVGDEAKDV